LNKRVTNRKWGEEVLVMDDYHQETPSGCAKAAFKKVQDWAEYLGSTPKMARFQISLSPRMGQFLQSYIALSVIFPCQCSNSSTLEYGGYIENLKKHLSSWENMDPASLDGARV